MKKLILTGLGFLFAITLTFAQEGDAEQKAKETVATLTEKLTLNDAQQTAIYPIVLEAKKTKFSLKADTTLSAEDLQQRIDALETDTHTKVSEQLTDEQKEAFSKYRDQKKSKK